MSKYDVLKSAGVAYNGYAFSGEEVKQLWQEAYDSIKDIEEAVERIEHGYNENTYVMKQDKIAGLHPVQVLALANRAPLPFGGLVSGNKAKVYTD